MMDPNSRQKQQALSSDTPLVPFSREETTLAALPLFALEQKKRWRSNNIMYETRLSGVDVDATLQWRVSADPVYGHPDVFDRKVFKIVEYLAVQSGLPIKNPYRVSLDQILQLLGLAPFPFHFARIRSAIRRIAAVTVHSELTFFTGHQTGRSLQTLHLYDSISFHEARSDTAHSGSRYVITFGTWYLENLNQQYLRPIDIPYFRSLHNHIASRLYELLTVKFEETFKRKLNGWQVAYPVLCRLLPIRPVIIRSPIKQLEIAHNELIKTGFLKDVTWEKINRTWMILYMPGQQARTLRQAYLPEYEPTPQLARDQASDMPVETNKPLSDQRTAPLYISSSDGPDLDYIHYWNLIERPFDNTPNPKFFYESNQHRIACLKLRYAISPYAGAMLLTGKAGSGKTLLIRKFIHELDEEHYHVILLTNPRWNGVELLQEILYQMGRAVDTDDKSLLIRMIEDMWYQTSNAGRHTVLIIDEAQLIEAHETFEELRLLLNFQMDDHYLATLILVGQPELNGQIQSMPQLDQRMAYRHHIPALSQLETHSYVQHRMETAGNSREVFPWETISLIYNQTEGIPRRINTLCNTCLLAGRDLQVDQITPEVVSQVIEMESNAVN